MNFAKVRRMAPKAIVSLLPVATIVSPSATIAGPPFVTDDPEPTDTGHWEIYAPLTDFSGRGGDYGGSIGAELNYGAAPDLQISLGLPASFTHGASGRHFGRGDLEVSAKYRFYDNAGLSIAVFPGITLPTASRNFGNATVTAFLPIWAQQDAGPWTIFGGGGYAVNPGAGNRDYWTGGVAFTRQIAKRLSLGVEVNRQGADTIGSGGSTSLGFGAILDLKAPFRLLASAGPMLNDKERSPGLHGFFALGLDF